MRQRLAESEERLRLAVEAGGIGVHDRNARTGAFYISPRLKEILGFAPEEEVDHALVLTEGDEVERLLISEVGVRRAHPESGCVVSHHFAGKVDNGAQFEQPLLGFPTRGGLLRTPASDAARVRIADPRQVGGVHHGTLGKVIEKRCKRCHRTSS